jgi:ATP/maltotriose-dependent transcriptional regulator MalT
VSLRAGVPLIGRDREVIQLHELLARARDGSHEAVLLEGEAGIGKTRLIGETIEHARGLGFAIYHSSADESDRSRTHGPLIDAFGGVFEDVPSRSRTTAADRRVAAIDHLVSIIDAATGSAPVALVLDDLHWADVETLRIVRSLVRTRTLAFVFVGATRPSPANTELERLIEAVTEVGGAHVSLDPLGGDAVAALIDRLAPDKPTPEFRRRVAAARGNPFFVIEVIAAGLDDGGSSDLSPDLRRTVLRRLAHLSDDAKAIVRLASILGPSIDISDLEVVVGRPSIELVGVLDEAVKGGVFEDRGDVLVFRHDLVWEAVYDDIPESVRRRSHRDVAHALIEAGAPARRVAPHLARSARPGDGEAVFWLRRAATEEAQRSPTVAADMLTQAADLLGPDDPARDGIDAERVQALAWAGRLAEASAIATELLSHPREPALEAVRAALGEALFFRGRLVEAGEQFEHAAANALGSERGLLIAEAALSWSASGQLDRADELRARAVEEAASTNDPRARSLAASVRVVLAGARADYAGLEAGREAVRIADEDASGETHRYGARLFLGFALIETDRFDEAVSVLRKGIRLDEANGVAWSLPCYHSALGAQFFVRGEWDDAVAELETAETLLDDMGSSILGPQVHGLLAYTALRRDDRERAQRELTLGEAKLAEAGPQTGVEWLVHTRVMLAEDAGDHATAAAIVRGAWGLADAMGFRLAFRYFGPTYIRLAIAEGDRVGASTAADAIERLSETATTRSMAATILLCRGMAEADLAKLLEAVGILRGSARPLDLAVACEQASGALATGGEVERARELRQEAIAIYERLGAHRDVRLASEALGDGGPARKRRGRSRPVAGWESLSPTERRVVVLVAEGLSNAAVAARMFVSTRTVETHLYHLFRKLSVTSRLELAVRANRELGDVEVQ